MESTGSSPLFFFLYTILLGFETVVPCDPPMSTNSNKCMVLNFITAHFILAEQFSSLLSSTENNEEKVLGHLNKIKLNIKIQSYHIAITITKQTQCSHCSFPLR